MLPIIDPRHGSREFSVAPRRHVLISGTPTKTAIVHFYGQCLPCKTPENTRGEFKLAHVLYEIAKVNDE